MSRRKQAKPQHLRAEEDARGRHDHVDGLQGDENSPRDAGRLRAEDPHICHKCCAQFLTWAELSEHQRVCAEDQLVLIVKDDEGLPPESPSPPRSVASTDSTAGSTEAGETLGNDNDSLDNLEEEVVEEEVEEGEEEEEEREREEAMELDQRPQDEYEAAPAGPRPPDLSHPGPVAAMPSTNVTLEILHSTRVAVAQFSQGISGTGTGGKAATAAIPVILDHLLALQQQQVHQLQLIEQICSQVAIMNKQPTQTASNPASRALSLASNTFPSPGIVAPPILPLSGTIPSAVSGQAAVSLASQSRPSQTACGPPRLRDESCTSAASSDTSAASQPSVGVSGASALLPPFAVSHSSGAQTLSSQGTLSLGPSRLLSASSNLPFLPQSPPSSVIFPNPLASIAATASALDPLAALMKQRKGKLPNVSLFETKPGPEEPFFKHKCRFCAKVFGSDSALQIHLRSHTGERPFKCNICGNRFSTKGNLKVHFQRHKEKYPHVQMNPYPVPEYLDNMPTSSGIPYGMSVPPEKPVSSWLECKPVVASLPSSMVLPLSSTLTGLGGSSDPASIAPSSFLPASGECASLSPNRGPGEPHVSPVSASPPETDAAAEGVHLPQNCVPRPRSDPAPSAATTPEPVTPSSPASRSPTLSEEMKFPPAGGLLDSMQTSETSKLQQLVENIDKKITDPNQCVLCHRVLSCQSALKMHYRIHTGERPFKCKVCGRAFTTKGNLKTHVGVHRENPPVRMQHSCPICQKKFTNAVVLQQHIRMHMVGQIPDANVPDAPQDEGNLDSLGSDDVDLLDDVSMGDDRDEEEEEDEVENTDEGGNQAELLAPVCKSPLKSSAVVSSIAALENQMRMIDATVNLNHSFGIKSLTNGYQHRSQGAISYPLTDKRGENLATSSPNVSESSCSPHVSASPVPSTSEGTTIKSPAASNRPESHEPPAASVKREQPDSPTAQAQPEMHLGKLFVKEESPYAASFNLSRERGQSVPGLVTGTSSGVIKTEMNGHSHPNASSEGQHPPFSRHIPSPYPSAGSPGMASLLGPAPPRRTPKQHNCNVCGKNFSSASALQIHERTHTGEKPFVCSICGRAFTTKGNLKVHMGTHMWNNAPARRGRRLSVENPMALLGGEAVKFGEIFQKDLAARAMNVDPGFWNRYATAITNSLAMKNNEISVIQNRGIPQLHPITAGMDRGGAAGGAIAGLGKTAMDLGNNRHFSMLIDDSKEIGIN